MRNACSIMYNMHVIGYRCSDRIYRNLPPDHSGNNILILYYYVLIAREMCSPFYIIIYIRDYTDLITIFSVQKHCVSGRNKIVWDSVQKYKIHNTIYYTTGIPVYPFTGKLSLRVSIVSHEVHLGTHICMWAENISGSRSHPGWDYLKIKLSFLAQY